MNFDELLECILELRDSIGGASREEIEEVISKLGQVYALVMKRENADFLTLFERRFSGSTEDKIWILSTIFSFSFDGKILNRAEEILEEEERDYFIRQMLRFNFNIMWIRATGMGRDRTLVWKSHDGLLKSFEKNTSLSL